MIDLHKLHEFPARKLSPWIESIEDMDASDNRSDSKHLSFFNLPLLGLCVASWAVVAVGAVAVTHLL